jgi:hypothetical protein
MSDASLALQTAVRGRLAGDAAVLAIVGQPGAVRDQHGRPADFPLIVIGAGQTVLERTLFSRRLVRVHLDLHLWVRAHDLAEVKQLAGAVTAALAPRLEVEGWRVVDHFVANIRFMRDPAGEYAHAVVEFEALVEDAP